MTQITRERQSTHADGRLTNLPVDTDFTKAEKGSESLYFGKEGSEEKTKFVYSIEGTTATVNLVVASSESGKTMDEQQLANFDQGTFRMLASIYASPIVSIKKGQKKIGLLFSESTIDVRNWPATVQYLNSPAKEEGAMIVLLILASTPGQIDSLYSDNVDRLGIFPSQFIPTNAYSTSIDIISNLVNSVKGCKPNTPIVYVLGAGASIEAKVMSTRSLMINAMKRNLKIDEASSIEYEDLESKFMAKIVENGRYLPGESAQDIKITFERIMTEELKFCYKLSESPTLLELAASIRAATPSFSHYQMTKIAKELGKPIFITTNYDDLVERAVEDVVGTGGTLVVSAEGQYKGLEKILLDYLANKDARIPILKLHGSIDDFESIKASVEHTILLETKKGELLTSFYMGDLFKEVCACLGQTEAETVIRTIYIGYSFSDKDIGTVFSGIARFGKSMHGFVVNPCPTENIILMLQLMNRNRGSHEWPTSEIFMNGLISLPFSKFVAEAKKLLK